MSRLLAIIAAAALTLSATFLGLAYVIGGDDVFHDPRSLQGIRPLIDLATHKEWHWAGGDTIALNAPVNLRYQPTGKPSVTVTGPAGVVQHVQFADGRITTDTNVTKAPGVRPQAVISGVPIRKFVVNGGETLELGHVDQDRMDIHVNGDGKVRGDGRVGRLSLVLSGSGDADLGALAVDAAKVAILGSGIATLAPRVSVEVFIAGSGRLALTAKPKTIKQNIVGSGEVAQLPEPPPPPPPPPPAPADIPPAPQVPPVSPFASGVHIDGDTVAVTGRHDKDLGWLDQDQLNLIVTGMGAVTASGRVNRLTVNLAGGGAVKLDQLSVKDADVTVAGSGDVAIAPTGDVKIRIMGSGNVRLLKRPASLEREILGSGRVIAPQ